MTMILAPRLAAFFRKVAATGWFCAGRAPMMIMQSLSLAAPKGAVTAPEPMPTINADTDEAWQSREQWHTLLGGKAVRHTLWKRSASLYDPLSSPKQARAMGHLHPDTQVK